MHWTTEQVAALAPDAASAKAGQGLASARKWVSLGHDERVLWGECQGSGAKPYQVIVDAADPAFRCTCPSRKFPCKHALGMLFLCAAQPTAVPDSTAPDWVAAWIAGREARAEKKAAKATEPAATTQPDPTGQARRAARREERVAAGIDELDRWLRDLIRQGLAALPGKPGAFWEGMAARLVDAQAPGAARLVRQLAILPGSGEGWPERLLERLGRLHLLVEGSRRLEALPESARHEVRTALGWTHRQEEILAQEGVRDRWQVLGQRIEEEDRLRVRRTWLRGEETGRSALLLSFAAGAQPLEPGPLPGSVLDGELAFYPGAYPMRAVVRERYTDPAPPTTRCGYASAAEAVATYADALARSPWIERLPFPLLGVVPVRAGDAWLLRDREGDVLPLHLAAGESGWTLLALSGGSPVDVFCEWDGDHLLPLSALADGRYVPLSAADGAPG